MSGGSALTPAQLEFLSEDEFVTIVPNFSQIPLQLISLSVRSNEDTKSWLTLAFYICLGACSCISTRYACTSTFVVSIAFASSRQMSHSSTRLDASR